MRSTALLLLLLAMTLCLPAQAQTGGGSAPPEEVAGQAAPAEAAPVAVPSPPPSPGTVATLAEVPSVPAVAEVAPSPSPSPGSAAPAPAPAPAPAGFWGSIFDSLLGPLGTGLALLLGALIIQGLRCLGVSVSAAKEDAIFRAVRSFVSYAEEKNAAGPTFDKRKKVAELVLKQFPGLPEPKVDMLIHAALGLMPGVGASSKGKVNGVR